MEKESRLFILICFSSAAEYCTNLQKNSSSRYFWATLFISSDRQKIYKERDNKKLKIPLKRSVVIYFLSYLLSCQLTLDTLKRNTPRIGTPPLARRSCALICHYSILFQLRLVTSIMCICRTLSISSNQLCQHHLSHQRYLSFTSWETLKYLG